jgi:hypothetical protein
MSNENTNYFRNFIPRDRKAERRRRRLRSKKINLKDLHSNRTIRKYIKYPTYSFVETLPIIIHNKYTTYETIKEEYVEEEKEELEEKYPDLSDCWNTEQLKNALKLSIMTNNVDIERRKNNYITLGRAEFEEDELEKWKYDCDKLTKQKNPCKKLIEKRKDLNKTFKHIIGVDNKYQRKKFYKKYNYINSIIRKKYGYKK